MRKFYTILLLVFFPFLPASAQHVLTDGLNYEVSANASFSGGDHTPFWFTANRYGLSSVDKNNGYVRAGIFRPLQPEKRFTFAYGLDLAAACRFTSDFVIQQAYLQLKYRSLGVEIGSRQRASEMKNEWLSAGGLTESANARPIPQVRVGLLQYSQIPRTDWLFIKGWVAYGRMTDDRFQRDYIGSEGRRAKGVVYHNKAVFIKADNGRFPLFAEAGAIMSAQFGGKSFNNGVMTDLPSSLSDYFKAFIPLRGGDSAPIYDQLNVNGNQVGSWLFSLGYRLKDWTLRAYYEHFYEDHSMMFFQYPWYDGQIGLELTFPKNPFATSFVYEYLGMKDQAGPIYHDSTPQLPDQISARDNYYNHGIYPGWQHWGMGIGNPLLISPLYNDSRSFTFLHNRIKSHHFGISGNPSTEWSYRLLATCIRSWGTYDEPTFEVEKDFSGLLEVTYLPKKLAGWHFTGAIAFDYGDLIGHSAGGMITVKKTGLFKRLLK